jgi:acetyltransferase
MARPGNVGFISQSGALCTAVLDWSLQGERGLQRLRLDRLDAGRGLGRPDLLPGRRPAIPTSIVIYMETIGDARAFLSAAREVALTKPIIVIKAGRTEAAPPRPPPRTPAR